MKSISLVLTGKDIDKIPFQRGQYITRTYWWADIFKDFMTKNGYSFDDQMGAWYIFSKDNQKIIVVSKQFTRMFTLWKINN